MVRAADWNLASNIKSLSGKAIGYHHLTNSELRAITESHRCLDAEPHELARPQRMDKGTTPAVDPSAGSIQMLLTSHTHEGRTRSRRRPHAAAAAHRKIREPRQREPTCSAWPLRGTHPTARWRHVMEASPTFPVEKHSVVVRSVGSRPSLATFHRYRIGVSQVREE
jgi:hypothetical protein